jgi:hypothetical protein
LLYIIAILDFTLQKTVFITFPSPDWVHYTTPALPKNKSLHIQTSLALNSFQKLWHKLPMNPCCKLLPKFFELLIWHLIQLFHLYLCTFRLFWVFCEKRKIEGVCLFAILRSKVRVVKLIRFEAFKLCLWMKWGRECINASFI